MPRVVARLAASLLFVATLAGSLLAPAVALAPAGAASASLASLEDCQRTFLASGGRELFELPREVTPPPLYGFPADCASRIADRPFMNPDASTWYQLLYVDAEFDSYIAMMRAFEANGWGTQLIDTISFDETPVPELTNLSADDLAALEQQPSYAHGRFSDQKTGDHIIAISFYDGVDQVYLPELAGQPIIFIDVIITGPLVRSTGVTDPSVLSGLRTIGEAVPTATQAGVIAAGSVMLMLVVGWPSNLLNSVVGSRFVQLSAWVRRVLKLKPAPVAESVQPEEAAPTKRASRIPGWLMWPGFALAAVLGAFVDPEFGLNPMSARVVVTLFLSFVLFNLLAWTIVRRVAARLQPESRPFLRFRWGSLLLVAIAVVIARLLEFEPGIIFGLVAGIAYATTLQASRSAIIVLVGSGFGLALALVAWVGYSLLAPVAEQNAGNLVLVFAVEFLSGVTVKGISSLPLALLPLGTLDGTKLLRWKKWVWALSYAVGLAAFMLVMLTIPKAWGSIPGDFVRWLVIFGLYALAAVVIWALNVWALVRAAKREPVDAPDRGEEPEATTID